MFVFYVVGRGGGGDSWAALNQFYQELGDTFHHPLLRIASLDVRQSPRLHANAVGAHIITGAARATVATGRVAVAIGEADVAALLADGARRRSCETEQCRETALMSRRARRCGFASMACQCMPSTLSWRAQATNAGGVLDFKVERAAKVSVCASAGSRIARIDGAKALGVC